ncbi:MAG TPA: TGS domain-containing protein [Candidatus Latescibacteria bacterium]|nr:TGS domain-containing protein [Candidatus Latescibacterota bacterium]
MPANLPPEYFEVEKRYRFAKTAEEKIAILQEMLAVMPKHKGTERLEGDLKAKIAKLKRQSQRRPASGKRADLYHIEKEGAGQVVLVGTPNVGKSSIVGALTNATPEIAPYPFTTRRPLVGMMPFEDIQIQLVDTPPVTGDFREWRLLQVVVNSDLILLTLDLGSDDVLGQVEAVIDRLRRWNIALSSRQPEEVPDDGKTHKSAIIVGNKSDMEGAEESLRTIKGLYADRFPVISISAKNGHGLEELKRRIYKELDIVRIYTKAPGRPVDRTEPIILRRGETVMDAAIAIHKDFASKLKYARLWGSDKFDGQRAERDHVLKDGDIVEFHIR